MGSVIVRVLDHLSEENLSMPDVESKDGVEGRNKSNQHGDRGILGPMG